MKIDKPLDITYHNPNAPEDLLCELIKLAAQIVKARLLQKVAHAKTAETVKKT